MSTQNRMVYKKAAGRRHRGGKSEGRPLRQAARGRAGGFWENRRVVGARAHSLFRSAQPKRAGAGDLLPQAAGVPAGKHAGEITVATARCTF